MSSASGTLYTSGVATSSRTATPGPTDPTSPSKPNGPPETVKYITATRGPSRSPAAFMGAGFVTAGNFHGMMFCVAGGGAGPRGATGAPARSGPGGATAALELARQGLKVVLLEKERLPRYKTCGGGLVERSLALLPPEVGDVVERRYASCELHLLDADLHFTGRRDHPVVSLAMRDRLDFLLASRAAAAGAELRAPCRRSEEHTSELQSRLHLVCRLLLEKKKENTKRPLSPTPNRRQHARTTITVRS